MQGYIITDMCLDLLLAHLYVQEVLKCLDQPYWGSDLNHMETTLLRSVTVAMIF